MTEVDDDGQIYYEDFEKEILAKWAVWTIILALFYNLEERHTTRGPTREFATGTTLMRVQKSQFVHEFILSLLQVLRLLVGRTGLS